MLNRSDVLLLILSDSTKNLAAIVEIFMQVNAKKHDVIKNLLMLAKEPLYQWQILHV